MDWHVQELGDPEGHRWRCWCTAPALPPILFAGSCRFSPKNHHVIAIDLPGHGFTRGAKAHGGSDAAGHGARACRSSLKLGLNPCIAIGHSAGVAVLLQMALSQSFAPGRIVGLNSALEPIRGNALLSPLAKLLFANPLTSRLVSFQARMVDMAGHLHQAPPARGSMARPGRDCYAMLLRQPAHVSGALGMMANWNGSSR
jgi:magnesium chelatase accessory protein